MAAPKGNQYAEGGGRPPEYEERFNNVAYKLCLLGATDKELAEALEVSEQTINNWKKRYPKFSLALKKGKIQADANVAAGLYKRATGFTQTTTIVKKNEEGEPEELHHETYYPPDPTSMIYWLKNRRANANQKEGGQRWADKHEHVHGGKTVLEIVRKPKNATDPE